MSNERSCWTLHGGESFCDLVQSWYRVELTSQRSLGVEVHRCYSHLSDDEREQIGLAEALGHSIGAIAQAI